MNWTSEKPTAAGWYWIRAPKHGWRDCVLWVDQDDDGFYIDVGDCDTEYVTDIDAEWLGPITPDSYQQGRVAGLREAAGAICMYCNDPRNWAPMSNSGYHVCNTPGPNHVRCQATLIHELLAQQAKDEKGVGE